MSLRPVLPGVFQIQLPWTNAWLLAKNNDAVIIDTGTSRDRRRLVAALYEAIPTGIRLHSILLTHGHVDHAGNASFLAREFGSALCAHALEVPYVEGGRSYARKGIRGWGRSGILFRLGDLVYPVERGPIARCLAGNDEAETPIGPIRVVHTPGHTDGHVSFIQEEKGWLFSGDALLNIIPWMRKTGLSLAMPVFSIDMKEAGRSARRLADLQPSALLPGHGPPILEAAASSIRRFASRLPE